MDLGGKQMQKKKPCIKHSLAFMFGKSVHKISIAFGSWDMGTWGWALAVSRTQCALAGSVFWATISWLKQQLLSMAWQSLGKVTTRRRSYGSRPKGTKKMGWKTRAV